MFGLADSGSRRAALNAILGIRSAQRGLSGVGGSGRRPFECVWGRGIRRLFALRLSTGYRRSVRAAMPLRHASNP